MSEARKIASIAGLVRTREAEIDRMGAALARQEALRQRYLHNLDALRRMFEGVAGSSRPSSPLLAQNDVRYRQTLLDTIERYREALRVHEEDMQVARELMTANAVRCEVWRNALQRRQRALNTERQRAEQRAQDEMATRAWTRAPA